VDIRHGSSAPIDGTNDESLTDHDEQALDAIRRQLDMEFPHSADALAATGPHSADTLAATGSASRRRGWATIVVGLVVACAGAGAAAVLVIALYETLTPPAVVRESSPATPAAMPHLVTAAAPRPATTLPPPPNVDINTKPASRQRAAPSPDAPVPDVIRVKPAAFSIPTPVATPPPVADVASEAPAPPVDRAVTVRQPVRVVQIASEQARAAWDIVRERVVRPSGELGQASRSRPEAP
jgi:DUF3040 family protein